MVLLRLLNQFNNVQEDIGKKLLFDNDFVRVKNSDIKSKEEENMNVSFCGYDIQDFNRNCITPGTQFMEDLHQFLIQYIQNKTQNEFIWKSFQIIYSGYNVYNS